MIKKNKSRNRIITGILISVVILVFAIFARITGENLAADISIGGILPGISVDTDGFSLNAGGGNNSQPGCGSDNCLVPPDASEYSGIAVETSFRQFLVTWTNFFLRFLALVAMIFLIYAGFMYVTAAGNDEQAGKAKKTVIWVVVGIVIILLAYALVNTLITTGPLGSDT